MPTLIPLDNLLGAALIGIILSAVVYGITCLQVYLYYTEYSKDDRPFLKLFVAFIMVIDTFHLAILCHTAYYYTVSNFGDYLALFHEPWTLLVQIVIGNFLTSCVQFFFAYRIYRIGRFTNKWLPAVICLFSIGQFASGLGFTITAFQLRDITKATENIPWAWAAMVNDVICDSIITASMILYLNSSRTEFSKTNKAVNMLVAYSLNTGLVLTVFTVLTLATAIAYSKTLIYALFYFVVVRLYSCTFMSTLNSRGIVRLTLERDRQSVTFGSSSAGSRMRRPVRQVPQLKSISSDDVVDGGDEKFAIQSPPTAYIWEPHAGGTPSPTRSMRAQSRRPFAEPVEIEVTREVYHGSSV